MAAGVPVAHSLLTACISNENKAFCTTCHCDINVIHGERDDVRKHAITKKHMDSTKSLKQAGTIGAFFKKAKEVNNHEQDITRAEAIFVKTLTKTNLSFASAEKWMSAFKAMFPKSEVAQKMRCGRSKSTDLVLELAKLTQENLLKTLRVAPFTISTDGSNDTGARENIFKLIDDAFNHHGIPWGNCLALGCDNASVMVGGKKGFFGLMSQNNSSVYLAGCCCHLVHIAAQKGAAALPIDIEQMLVDTYYYLEGSSVRQADFQQLQIYHEVKQNKILKHVTTRWLSLKKCLPRFLKNWTVLEDLVKAELGKKGSAFRTECLLRMRNFLKPAQNKLYVMFLVDALEPFDYFNASLQCEEPMVHMLSRKLITLMKSIMHRNQQIPADAGIFQIPWIGPGHSPILWQNGCKAGDRSLADVIAHEISHSWTGNLVTNRTFEDFWLNEGHTMFLERKIVGRLKGINLRRIHASEGWSALQETVQTLRESGEEAYTRLVPDLRGVDPDDAFSSVPYEKGFALLYHLEQLLGGPDVFEPFLRAYIEEFKYKSISSQDWKAFLFEYFSSQEDQQKLETVDWNTWFYGLGMPPFQPDYDGALLLEEPSRVLSQRWISQPETDLNVFSPDDINNLPSLLVRQFLQFLLDGAPMPLAKVVHMEQVYSFNGVRNSEVRFRWLRLCIKARWVDCIPLALNFVTEQGRMKFVRPVYKDLNAWEEARAQAIANFNKVRHEMHSTTAMLVAKDLGLEE
ncbi:leukotriene a-4 hydrolase [Plakobranchus ocellatus]|uniref:Leukotriene a-4 hydrolase n=1 Tax=Plakobranchus ocellatus TaxID=259542 RepID=A0AAV4CCV4_9GAST|nr:leukotriene a-4 hydrolase [Plakobranchus ocellatus]